MLNNKVILVTGGTGSFGQRFVQTVLERYSHEANYPKLKAVIEKVARG